MKFLKVLSVRIANKLDLEYIYLINKQILKPLNETSSMLEHIAQGEGDLTQELKIKNDEIQNLKHLTNQIEVIFGVKEENSICFSQHDNLIFNLNQNNREDEAEGKYVVEIITDNRNNF